MAYRVGDDQDVGLGGSFGSGLGEVADNRGVGVEQVVTGHTGLAGNTSGDEDNLGSLEGIAQAIGVGLVAADVAVGVDVAQVGRDTWSESVSISGGSYATKGTYRDRHGYRRGRAQRHGG